MQRDGLPMSQAGADVLLVAAGKGGVGTSTVAALLALAFARTQRVLLVDGAPDFGPQHLLFGVDAPHALGAIRTGRVAPEQLLVAVTETLTLLPSAATDAPLAPGDRAALLPRLQSLYEGFDLVIVDGGSRLDTLAAHLAGATRLVAVAGADRIALASTHALMKAAIGAAPTLAIDVVFNRHESQTATRAFDTVQQAAERFLGRTVRHAGSLPDDACLELGVGGGMSLPDAASDSPVLAAAQEIASRLFPSVAGPTTVPAPRIHSGRSLT